MNSLYLSYFKSSAVLPSSHSGQKFSLRVSDTVFMIGVLKKVPLRKTVTRGGSGSDTHCDNIGRSYEDRPTTGCVVVGITDRGSVEESKTCTPGENTHTNVSVNESNGATAS